MSRRTRRQTAESEIEEPEVSSRKTASRKKTKSTSEREPMDERPPHVDPPEHEIVGPDFIQNTYDGHLNKRDIDEYLRKISVKIINEDRVEKLLEFDLINVEAAFANTIRRIMIAEVPTMAFEKIMLYQNDTVFQDEVLCHRLGLLPVYADARQFDFPDNPVTEPNAGNHEIFEEPEGNPKQNLIFEVNMKCKKKKVPPADVESKHDNFDNSIVKSGAFKWVPIGDQAVQFEDDPPRMVHDDIIVIKMRHGQEIEARCHCVKGIGRDHAKFSPVGTASYRLLPEIILKKEIDGELAERLQKSFSSGVIETDENGVAYVKNARLDTLSRNVFRYDDLKDAVEIRRKKNHFIFSVESIGQYQPNEIVSEACNVMVKKIGKFRDELQKVLSL
jgi:DNA-directed RNA polymerase I and III subunit RPAC1